MGPRALHHQAAALRREQKGRQRRPAAQLMKFDVGVCHVWAASAINCPIVYLFMFLYVFALLRVAESRRNVVDGVLHVVVCVCVVCVSHGCHVTDALLLLLV